MLKYIAKMQKLATKVRPDEGATMVEYALIVVAIALVVLAGAYLLGTGISSLFNSISTSL
jgi:Flp pilus assembly pilin Flp